MRMPMTRRRRRNSLGDPRRTKDKQDLMGVIHVASSRKVQLYIFNTLLSQWENVGVKVPFSHGFFVRVEVQPLAGAWWGHPFLG